MEGRSSRCSIRGSLMSAAKAEAIRSELCQRGARTGLPSARYEILNLFRTQDAVQSHPLCLRKYVAALTLQRAYHDDPRDMPPFGLLAIAFSPYSTCCYFCSRYPNRKSHCRSASGRLQLLCRRRWMPAWLRQWLPRLLQVTAHTQLWLLLP